MAFTYRYRNTIPSDSVSASQIDDHIRRLRTELQERFNALLGGSGWTTDPLTGQVYQFVHWSGFNTFPDSAADLLQVNADNGLSYNSTGSASMYHNFMVPRGCTIDEIKLTCSTGSTGTIPWDLIRLDAGTPSDASQASGTVGSSTSFTNTTLTGTDVAVDSGASNYYHYYLKLTLANGGTANDCKIYGIRVALKFSGSLPKI